MSASASPSAWAHARQLVVGEGTSLEEAAAITGIPLSTLQKRSAAEQWRSQRGGREAYASQVF